MRSTTDEAELIGAAVVAQARLWVGTPYKHQHRQLGVGCDCVGLIIGVGRATQVLELSDEDWEPYEGYSTHPNPRKMVGAMHRFMVPLDLPPKPAHLPPDGAVMHLGWREHLPMHLAILATDRFGRRTMIHAFKWRDKVVEHGFVAEWPERVISWWTWPGLPMPGLELSSHQEGA